jgi:hypothetical protein
MPLGTRTKSTTAGQRHIHVGQRATSEHHDVGQTVTVHVGHTRILTGDAEELVPLHAGAETGSGGQRHIHISRRVTGERNDVVEPVPVHVTNRRNLATQREIVMPLETRPER